MASLAPSKMTSSWSRLALVRAPAPASTIDRLRRRSVAMIAAAGWVALAVLLAATFLIDTDAFKAFMTVGLLVNLLPTFMAMRGRYDAEARAAVGSLAAVMPALLVYLLNGHPWQMDGHMYFFVSLAMLVVLCDWKPIVLASGLIAVHHLVLEWLAPAWVFTGTGNLGRVAFHAVAVILQCAVLSYVTSQLARLLHRQDVAVDESRQLARQAELDRARADNALIDAQSAAQNASAERHRRGKIEKRVASERSAELQTLANEFERTVSGVVKSIETAATDLAQSSSSLNEIAGQAGDEADDVATSAEEAATDIRLVAQSLHRLSMSVSTIAGTAQQQEVLTKAAYGDGLHGVQTITSLVEHAERITTFVETIKNIAVKTNMLALNATIEAARAGDAGRGFVVVAGEIKTLASDAAHASDEIAHLLESLGSSASESKTRVENVTISVAEVLDGAGAIVSAVADQRSYAAQIETSASRAASNADAIEHRITHVASAVMAASSLSGEVRRSAAALLTDAGDLRSSTDRFVHFLREDL